MSKKYDLLRRWAADEFGMRIGAEETLASNVDDLSRYVEKISREFAQHAARSCGLPSNGFDHRIKQSYIIMDPEVNGFVTSSDDWETFEMGINYGLMSFVHKTVKIFIANPNFRVQSDEISQPNRNLTT